MPNSKEDKEQVSLYIESDLVDVVDNEAGKQDLSRSHFCSIAIKEYIARLHSKRVCEILSQARNRKSK